MNKKSKWAWGLGLLGPSWPAWAASSTPGIDPTLFVLGVAGAAAGGAVAGYFLGKSSGGNNSNRNDS